MKARLIALAALLCCLLSDTSAQGFWEDGSEWHYHYVEFGAPGYSYNRFHIDGDTTIQGQACKILHRQEETCDFRPLQEYIFEEEGRMYYFHEEDSEFKILYDFSLEAGDTMSVEYWHPLYSDTWGERLHIRIDSVDTLMLDTVALKRFSVSYDMIDWDDTMDYSFTGTIVEHIGSLTNLFHVFDNGWCDHSYNINLRCFSHPVFGTYQFTALACQAVPVRDLPLSSQIELFPNPTNGAFALRSEMDVDDVRFLLLHQDGREVSDGYFRLSAGQAHMVDLSTLPNSLYIVNLFDEQGQLFYSSKIIKE